MALDTKTFKTRAVTAIIFAAIMLTGLLWNGIAFLCLAIIIHFGCWREWIRLLQKTGMSPKAYFPLGILYITLPIALLIIMGFGSNEVHKDASSFIYSPLIPCAIIFSIWVNDTMAYITGSFFGRRPLSPISPKKTWEGTIGGVLLCVLVITIAGNFIGFFPWYVWMFISLLSAVAGTFGDLLESKLKRIAGVKDSGTLMPGHGGFLDRFDSLLVAVPFVFVYYSLFLK